MDFGDYVRLLRRSAWIIVAAVLLGILAASGLTLQQKPVYAATATGIVSGRGTNVTEIGQVQAVAIQTAKNLTLVGTGSSVLQRVISDLHLDTDAASLAARISVANPDSSPVLTVSANAPQAATAAAIANGVMTELNASLVELQPGSDTRTVSLQLRLTNAATASGEPESPKPMRNLALGALVGFVLALVIAVLRQLLDNRLTTAHDLERITDRPLLGQFLREERPPRSITSIPAFSASPGAEAVRTLRTNLRFLDPQLDTRSFVVTSSAPHEDRTELAATLAIAMADLDRRVLVVDADLRRGKLASYLGLEGGIGMTDVLRDEVRVADAIQRWGLGQVSVLPAGSSTDRPNELIQSAAMARLVAALQRQFDVVIFTSPPLLVASDAAILANATGGALVIVEMGRTTRAQLVAALTALDRVGAETIGLVATELRAASRQSRYARRPARRIRRPDDQELQITREPADEAVATPASGVPRP